MKALKEKRIGLRSLWRRGLVILSLFALVFASCNDSGGEVATTPGSGQKVPLEIRVKTHPKNTSYEGMPVDITGLEIEARYSDAPNTWVDVKDLSKYGVVPKYTQRYGGTNGGGKANYTFYTIGDGTPVGTTIEVTVSDLVRSNATNQTAPDGSSYKTDGSGSNQDSNDYWAQGVQIYAPVGGYKDKYYVDDFPDFTGIHVQGHYRDGKLVDIPLNMDMRWEIRPNYKNATKNDEPTGPGDLVISIGGWNGAGYSLWEADGTYSQGGYAPDEESWNSGLYTYTSKGIEVSVPLSEVYHVTDITLKTPPAQEGILYWEKDTSDEWLSADGRKGRIADAVLEVTYSNGVKKERDMATAVRMNTVWYNLNPDGKERPLTVEGIQRSVELINNVTANPWPNYKKPMIYIYYRGFKVPCDMVIYTKLSTLTAKPKNGGVIEVDMTHQDNDKVGKNASWFADQIDVVATFTAYSDPAKTKELPLKFQDLKTKDLPGVKGSEPTRGTDVAILGKPLRDLTAVGGGTTYLSWVDTGYGTLPSGTGSSASTWDGGPYVYTMNFGTPDYKWYAGPGTLASGVTVSKLWVKDDGAWGESSLSSNNGRTRNVTIYYTPGIGLAYPFNSADAIAPKSQKVQVLWKNIPALNFADLP